jgi:hypothetical protein
MKIALYTCPHVLSKSSIYITCELINYFSKKYNYKIDLFIPEFDNTYNQNIFDYIDKKYASINNLDINWSTPSPKKYNILLLINVYSKIVDKYDSRIDIAKLFINRNRPVFVLKYDTTLEYRFIDLPGITYGVNTNYILPLRPDWIITEDCKKFIFPSLNYYSIPKSNSISKKKFYKIYKLNPKFKTIIFFVGRNGKWLNIKNQYTKPMHWFLNNIKIINNILYNNNYQLIFKAHKGQSLSSNITIIQPEHTYESIKYSSFAFTFGTSMVYQLYLYNLPSLEIGHGMYYPRWYKYFNNIKDHDNIIKQIIPLFDFGRNLIFGSIYPFKELSKNPQTILTSFLNTKFDISKFKYKYNNPIYGNSYDDNIDTICLSLYKQISS